MAAPTLIASVQIDSPWSQATNIANGVTTKNYASTLSTQNGDLIVALQGLADGGSGGELTVTDGANSYTQRTNIQNSSHSGLNIATAPDAAGGTRTLTFTRSIAPFAQTAGGVALQFRNHGGVGNVLAASDGVQTGNLTCSANSAICVIALDWNATAGSRTWANINGSGPTSTFGVDGDGATWAAAVAYFADVGAAGSKTITLSSPTFGAASFAAIEILAGSPGPIITAQPQTQAVREGGSATYTVAATVTGTPAYQWKLNGSNVGTNSASYTLPATIALDGAQVTCTVTDDNGSTTSAVAYLYVLRVQAQAPRRRTRSATTFDYSAKGWFSALLEPGGAFDRDMIVVSASGSQNLAGAAAVQTTATAALSLIKPLAAAAAAVASASGAMSLGIPLAGAAAGNAGASADLSKAVALAAAAAAQASASGALSVSVLLAGQALASVSASGTLQASGQADLAGSAAAQASATGALSLSVALQAAAVGDATASGALSLDKPLAAAAVAQATASGSLSLSIALAGAALAQASAAAAFQGVIALSGAAAAQAGAQATLSLSVPLSASALAAASASGGLVISVNLTGAAVALAAASGGLSLAVHLGASGVAQATANGTLTVLGEGVFTRVPQAVLIQGRPVQVVLQLGGIEHPLQLHLQGRPAQTALLLSGIEQPRRLTLAPPRRTIGTILKG